MTSKSPFIKSFLSLSGLIITSVVIFYVYQTWTQVSERKVEIRQNEKIERVRTEINKAFRYEGLEWPSRVSIGSDIYTIDYTLNDDLTEYIKILLRHFRSDYSSIVVIDNETGAILSAVGHERSTDQFNKNLAFSSTHPAASLIKIVVSADLLERGALDGQATFRHPGRGTTLYRSQLKNTNSGREVSFQRAFAFSNNVVFGQAAIQKSSGQKLYDMANSFGFNRRLMPMINLSESRFDMAKSEFNLAELASGFNRETMVSPVHAAILSSIVANDGELVTPHIVSRISGHEEDLWNFENKKRVILSPDSADELSNMMEATVLSGTARSHFNTMRHGLRPKLRIGGKTGTITGGIPHGRRDWFSAYAVPNDERFGKGISVAVMNINLDKWYVRSTHLAKRVIEYYFNNVFPLDETNESLLPIATTEAVE